jgi:hypothetical protein
MSATIEEDENANELQFGNIDFEETETLTNDEVYLLLLRRQNAGVTNEWVLRFVLCHIRFWATDVLLFCCSLFEQTFNYLERVTTTKVAVDIETLTVELRE